MLHSGKKAGWDMSAEKARKSKARHRLLLVYAVVNTVLIALLITGYLFSVMGSDNIHYYPEEAKTNLKPVLERITLAHMSGGSAAEDYSIILHQAGLGRPVVDDILFYEGLTAEAALTKFRSFQEDIYAHIDISDLKIGIVTASNKNCDSNGELINGFEIASLKDGDIIITESTHTFGWRHGHAAIVVDAKNRKILEAALWGYDTQLVSIDYWRHYSSFIQLRLKSTPEGESLANPTEMGEKAAAIAMQYLFEIPYGFLTGIPAKSPALGALTKTQCAHLVWYPYYQLGYDIDSDGSWLVTPRDIVNSDYFEVVQIYGVNPDALWP